MQLPINHSDFQGRDLSLRTAGFFKGAAIYIDGAPAKHAKGKYLLQTGDGRQIEGRIKRRILDPVPNVEIGGETIELARPLKWYEYVWTALPIAMIFAGGALGAMLGVLAMFANAQVFRGSYSTTLKYVLTGAISVASVFVFIVLVSILQSLLSGS